METKTCTACKMEKSLDDFYLVKKNDPTKRTSTCKACSSIRQREYRYAKIDAYRETEEANKLRRKIELRTLLHDYLEGKSCVDCGYNARVEPMQFDHLDRSTKIQSVSEMISRTWCWEKIQAEIEKCELVCANCHAIRTAKQFGWYSYL